MCDHCSKVTNQKGYSGEVTCRCEHGEKKEDDREKMKDKEKDLPGCCSKKAKEAAGGCCLSGCCKDPKDVKEKKKDVPGSMGCAKDVKKDQGGGCCGKK
ncbi:uncharacterized protein LOC107265439 isoform X1 [Cephus cinctus]|uniref:Uncharacterized protein LOC107265439 isoform X1 n=1 Tax=Cephus cinctus TaxID=211228 RepID=A0AAJ7BNF5_CEPCN|nr:uncharacterized protein LOC107265439 isoform X1 [Cephus cinctus]